MRTKTVWEHVFISSVILLVSIAYVNMGCAIDLDVIIRTIKKPVAPAIGVSSQYVFMPLVSFKLCMLYCL